MIPFTGILAPVADLAFLAQVATGPETGAITWPNGVDLDPEVLYAEITRHTRRAAPRHGEES